MNVKLIATDMDGTLLDSKKRMPEGLFEWIKAHSDIRFVIASGRQYYTLKKDFIPVHDDLTYIAENGALIYENDNLLYYNKMEKVDITYCLNIIEKMKNAKPILCGADSAYMISPDEEEYANAAMYYDHLKIVDDLKAVIDGDIIVKIAIYFKNFCAEEYYRDFDVLPKHLRAVLSGESWIDIANSSVNKGKAITEIQKMYGIDRRECMAFGDYLNDYDLLLSCEESYCMANGHDTMKEIAKYIAPSNDDDGVMKVLRERFK